MRFAKKTLSVFMSIALVMGLCPGLAYARGSESGGQAIQAAPVKQALTAEESGDALPAAKAVLYKNGDFVFQASTDPDGSDGHTAADVLATYEDASTTRWVESDEDSGEYVGGSVHAWYDARESIRSVSVNGQVALSDAEYLFYECENLASVDLRGLDASKAGKMDAMFRGCSALASLDLSGLDTSHARDMGYMFCGCSALASLELSGLDTSNVTDMGGMFDGCASLATLDLSSFDTSNVWNMFDMFCDCSSLVSLDLSGFKTSSVRSMTQMLFGCSALTSIDLSGFDTTSATDMAGMFEGCSSLASLDVSGFDTSNVTDMRGMFDGCSSLASLDVSGFDTSSVTTMRHMFEGCSSLAFLDLSGFDTSNVTDMYRMFLGCSLLQSLELSGLDTSRVTLMSEMFSHCTSLKTLGLIGFDTSKVTGMSYMFSDCTSLKTLDLSGFDTSSVTDMGDMFDGCSSMARLEVGQGWRNAEDAGKRAEFWDRMADAATKAWFEYGSAIPEGAAVYIKALPSGLAFVSARVERTLADGPFSNPLSKDTPAAVHYTTSDPLVAAVDAATGEVTPLAPGTCTVKASAAAVDGYEAGEASFELVVTGTATSEPPAAKAVLYSNGDLVFQASTDPDGSEGHTAADVVKSYDSIEEGEDGFPVWYEQRAVIKKVLVREAVSLDDAANLFRDCSNLESAKLTGLDTSSVASMACMFCGCSSLTAVELTSLDTSNLKSTYYMFQNCLSLKSLDLSGFNMSGVTDMGGMFSGCQALSDIDLSRLDTHSAQSMGSMFHDCQSLVSLDLSTFNTSKVNNLYCMFAGCTSLETLDLSSFDTSSVDDMRGMFEDCGALSSIDISSFDTRGVSSELWASNEQGPYYEDGLSRMLARCEVLERVSLGPNSLLRVGCELPEGTWRHVNGAVSFTTASDFIEGYDGATMAGTWLRVKKLLPAGLVFGSARVERAIGDGAFANLLTKATTAAVFYASSDPLVASVDASSGRVTPLAPGTCTITASAPAADGYEAGEASFALTVTGSADQRKSSIVAVLLDEYVAAYTGKACEPKVTVVAADGSKVPEAGYDLTWSGALVDAGTYTATVTGKGGYKGSATVQLIVNPASIQGAKLELSATRLAYTGKVRRPSIVSIGGKKLKAGTDFTAKYSNAKSAKLGSYTVRVVGKGNYTGTSAKSTYRIVRLANPVKVTVRSPKVKYSKVRRAKQTLAVSKAFKVTGNKGGAATYEKVSGSKKLSVSKKGKVTVAKKANRGMYAVKVKVTFAAKGSYDAASKVIKLKVRVV